ncbi:hypothetical protein [uncultured Acinetobacter sp.]|uniref:hypothetical protein n=1 Tax=uncultured Acinetobacter sp. TaxID=165433 RepID=UPI0025F2C021|nr:hypothetical protein [uncultured Acinetobacter sp.]
MNLEQYFRKKEIEKLAKEVAKKSVAEIMGKVSMFKVGEAVVLKNSIQNKVMKIQAHNDEFIRAYWSKGEYSFAHESNFRHATPEEIAAGQRIESSNDQAISDCSVSNLCQNDTQNSLPIKQESQDMGEDSHIENHISPLCKVEVK